MSNDQYLSLSYRVLASIWKLCETGKAKGYVSTLTIANLIYIMKKQLTPWKNR